MHLHPELARALALLQDLPPMDLATTPVPMIRTALARMQLPGPDVVLHAVQDLEIARRDPALAPLRARLYRPAAASGAPLMVYLHGGGWCLGSLESHDGLCRHLAHLSGMNVCAVDYRLAPEHRFPAALDDAWEATRWLASQAAQLHSDPQRLVLAGDSAGGNLAIACGLRARDEGWQGIAAQLLLYPVCDARMQTPSHRIFHDLPMLSAANMAQMWRLYHPATPVHPMASVAEHETLQGLPPTVMVAAGLDILRDEALDFAQRLEQAQVRVALIRAEGMVHGFANFSAMAPAVAALLGQACTALEKLLPRQGLAGGETAAMGQIG